MATTRDAEAVDAAAQAGEVLAPEASLLADTDAALLGRALQRASTALLRDPFTLARVSAQAATRAMTGMAATAARMIGSTAPAPFTPPAGDKRFRDPAWDGNPAYFAVQQAYLWWAQYSLDLVDAAGLDEHSRQKATLAAQMLIDALAPTNFLPTNPAAVKKAFDTGGASLLRGLRNFLDDAANNGWRPRQVDTSGLAVGRDLAATPGKVVYRNDLMELIQYEAQTETVHEIPLLMSPPWINKYYVMDLSPGRSFIEWAVKHGHTVFMISYRNPDASMRDIRLDDYLVDGPRAALDVVCDITGAEKVNMAALCLGGTLTVALLAYLAAVGDDRVNSATLLNTLIDFSEPGPLGCFTDEETVARLEQKMARTGYLKETELATTFDILRANDLIWNYVASNWLMGENPPAFDILAWNSDSTRMPAKMHSFYLRACYIENQLARGEMELDGVRLDLGAITQDVYIVGAEKDHIAPWRASYQTTQLLKGDVRYVLSSSGHIAGIVNPPSKKAKHWTNELTPPDPDAWRAGAVEHQASWWEDWAEWIAERAGDMVAPPPLGSDRHPPRGDAPGEYVLER